MTRRRTLLPVSDPEGLETNPESVDLEEDSIVTDEVQETEPEEHFWDDEEIEHASRPRGTWVLPVLAIAAIAGWTGFFAWVHQVEMLGGASPAIWLEWVSTWSMPVLLVIGVWLLAMRNSRREANRFTDAARALAHESAQLESRLGIVNRELAIARDFIASQSRDLESLGRLANDRLSTNADRLQTLIHDNHAQVEAIGSVSGTALSNMENLRHQLPVVANAARDMSNQIGNAGNVAQGHIEQLVAGFDRLNQFGEVSERHVERIGEKVGSTLELFDRQMTALGEATHERFEKLRTVSEGFRTDLELSQEEAIASIRARANAVSEELRAHDVAQRENEQTALVAMRERLEVLSNDGERLLGALGEGREEAAGLWNEAIVALETRMTEALAQISQVDERAIASARQRLGELAQEAGRVDDLIAANLTAFDEDMARRRDELAARETDEIGALEDRLEGLDQRISDRQVAHVAHVTGITERAEALAERLAVIDSDMQRLAGQGAATRDDLSEAAQGLADKLSQSRAVLEESGTFVARLTDDSVRLLEIIRSGADHSEGALSDSIGTAERRLAQFGEEASRLHGLIGEAEMRGETLAGHITSAREGSAASLEHLQALETHIGSVASESERLAQRTGDELRAALEQLSSEASHALEGLREGQREVIAEIAERIAEDSKTRIAEAVRENALETIAELEAAVARASENSHATTVGLRDQLGRVNELVGNLEQRITYARERAEQHVDHDFSRRMALITEALNSSSIDIAKAFDNEVSDTQWTHYLRGDRGIFTRRAVRLLDKQEARAIAEIYGEDAEFRETVNRFIHDFEAMLREVLSTRDGNAMAVTLLSSEQGKLYVALAQSIDRLRG